MVTAKKHIAVIVHTRIGVEHSIGSFSGKPRPVWPQAVMQFGSQPVVVTITNRVNNIRTGLCQNFHHHGSLPKPPTVLLLLYYDLGWAQSGQITYHNNYIIFNYLW